MQEKTKKVKSIEMSVDKEVTIMEEEGEDEESEEFVMDENE